jgi:hypothetical protein
MTWPASIGAALITAVTATLAAGFGAALAVEWYNIPGREGESGYFVVGLALLGFLAGLVIALATCRVVAAGAHPGFARGLGLSLAIVLGLVAIVTGTARLLADVPPTLDGQALLLAVEVRYPAAHTTSPATDAAEGKLTLHSIPHFSHTVRISQNGPLWKADAHQQDGHWIVPGAVNLFTERGKRMLEFNPGDSAHYGFLLPLGARPGRQDLAWSEWMPRARPGSPALPDQVTIRYRVQKGSEVIRTQRIGPFEIGTIPGVYYEAEVDGRTTSVSEARFVIASNGHSLALKDSGSVRNVAVIGGADTRLVIQSRPDDAEPSCYLVRHSTDGLEAIPIGPCSGYSIEAVELTNDVVRFRAQKRASSARGRINTRMFAEPGLFLLEHTVLDTRSGAAHPFHSDTLYVPIAGVPPLALSPDGRSFVRFGYRRESSDSLVLSVSDFVSDVSYILPVDPRRMRYPDLDALDPAWLEHHFEWSRSAGGFDHLRERAHFIPIPYQGAFATEGGEPVYRIAKAGRELRAALIAFLVRDFGAERMAADSDAYELPVRVGGRLVNVATSSDFSYVLVSMPDGGRDPALIGAIGERFNRELAMGKFDSLFAP